MIDATRMNGRRSEGTGAALRLRHAVLLGWLLALAMIAAITAAGPDRPLFRDTDDMMRAVQVLRWLDGAGWRDVSEPRLAPPDGVVSHWARLPDLPIAAAVLAAEPFVGRERALTVAAYAVPTGLLLIVMAAIAWAAVPFGAAVARCVPFLAAFCPTVLNKFFPGALDHHNWQIVLAALLVGGILRIALGPPSRAALAAVAAAGAVGLWIGGEMLPWLAVGYGALSLVWCLDRDWPARRGLAAATATTAVAVPLLWLVMPAGLGAGRCDAFSPAYAGYAAAGVPFWLALTLAESRLRSPGGRAAVVLAVAGAVAVLFLLLFPECRGGPLGAIPDELREAWLSRVSEARGLATMAARTPAAAVQMAVLPALGIAGAFAMVLSRRGDAARWIVQLCFLLAAFGLCFAQVRLLPFANLFALAPAVALLIRGWSGLASLPVAGRAILRALLLLAFTPIPYAAALPKGAPVKAPRICAAEAVGAAIRGDGAPIVAAPIDMGPALLLRTPASVLGAPYHRNVAGNLDLIAIMHAPLDEARRIVDRRQVAYVAVCRSLIEMDLYAAANPDGLAARLAAGEPPAWLEPVPTSGDPDLSLYRVRSD